jgi:hypothetical protein
MITVDDQSMTTPSVFIVVLNFNDYEDTCRCVRSLEKLTYQRFEIVIVDNASTDSSGRQLAKTFPHLKVINTEYNGGYAYGNNVGIRFAMERRADFIFILNNDTIVSKNTLNILLAPFHRNPTIGMTTCKIVYERTNKQYASAGSINRILCAILPLSEKEWNIEGSVSYIAGCAAMIRRSVFEKVGLLNEQYFMYFEDVEYSLRVAKHFTLVYTPNSTIYHKSGGGDQWHNYTPFYFYYSSRNRIITFAHSPLQKLHVTVVNGINVLMKIMVLLYFKLAGETPSVKDHICALSRGLRDGIMSRTGRNNLY